jgi:hypothetical protein
MILTKIGPALYKDRRGASPLFYSIDKQNNALSVISSASIQNSRDRIYYKATKLIHLKNNSSLLDIASSLFIKS